MNIEEFAEVLGISSYTLNHHWKRVVEQWRRKGVILVKVGKGMSAKYGVIEKGGTTAVWDLAKMKCLK